MRVAVPIPLRVETSAAQGSKECNRCGVCCESAPCLMLPDDVARLAQSPNGVRLDQLQVERLGPNAFQVRVSHTGKRCVHLRDDRSCGIQEHKPTGGREYKCWDATTFSKRYVWKGGDLGLIGAGNIAGAA
jgi:Fe-S-cluster containining protein